MKVWKYMPLMFTVFSSGCYAVAVEGGTKVEFSGTIIHSAPCKVNDGTQIVVSFDNVLMTQADGKQVVKNVPYKLNCTKDIKKGLAMKVIGTPGIDNQTLKTDLDGLGILLFQNDTPVTLNSWFNMPEISPENMKLTASPKFSSADKVKTGAFTATATLLVDWQ